MYLLFVWAVVKRAFTPTPRMTDGMQIAAASAVPAIGHFFGYEFPEGMQDSIFAYIGLAAVIFFAIRLFWAPYALWKEQGTEIGQLKLELSKPERLMIEELAKLRARHRLKIPALLDQIQASGFVAGDTNAEQEEYKANAAFLKCKRTAHKAGLPLDFTRAVMRLHAFAQKRRRGEIDRKEVSDIQFLSLMYEYLNDRITVEYLLSQSPIDIESETQP